MTDFEGLLGDAEGGLGNDDSVGGFEVFRVQFGPRDFVKSTCKCFVILQAGQADVRPVGGRLDQPD